MTAVAAGAAGRAATAHLTFRHVHRPFIAIPPWKHSDSSIVISWDENDYSGYSGGPGSPVGANGTVLGGGDAPLIVINSKGGKHRESNTLADHYTVLATVERMWHLGCLANTCSRNTSGSLESLFKY
ncbi:alkaline phosphatase family protein [Kitasatospora sp. RB6PN24]|uniref:alkaline phosphatase family protein n=1 Tax=Kitasatospora humi TaxID=2893891 RepID=UPI001E3592F1|nr:alkaline phosphatase family protein [Kitasatospora humi]MCC9310188.1 alkaline phosphatase family protein [Kitasatospora humi]